MRGFSSNAIEPVIGEIRAVRSFGLSDDGRLFPLGGSQAPWTAGKNIAVCARGRLHQVPASDCTCGFYAYLDTGWITARRGVNGTVTAVVAVWGETILGSRGVRCEAARIEAVCLPADVPGEVVAAVQISYPDVVVFAEVEQMLTEHPLSRLEGVRAPRLLAKIRPNPTLLWITYALYSLALVVSAIAGTGGNDIPLTAAQAWGAVAVIIGIYCVPMDGPARTWRSLLLPGAFPLLALGFLPWLIQLANAGTDLTLIYALLVASRVVMRWRARRRGTIVNPDREAREFLRRLRSSAWSVSQDRDGSWQQINAVSSPENSTVTYMAYEVAFSPLAVIPRIPRLLRISGISAVGLMRRRTVVSFSDHVPSSGWVDVALGNNFPITDGRQRIRMSVEEIIEILGVPPQALGR